MSDEIARRCSRCKEQKTLNLFAGKSKYCRECATDYSRERRHSKTLPPDDPRHGTVTGYTNWLCRCEPCKSAKATAKKEIRVKLAEADRVVCPSCGDEFSAKGFGPHRAACERMKARATVSGRGGRRGRVASCPGPGEEGTTLTPPKAKPKPKPKPKPAARVPEPAVSDWHHPGPGMVVLEVVEEMDPAELERVLARHRSPT